jgi:hypothetical protein
MEIHPLLLTEATQPLFLLPLRLLPLRLLPLPFAFACIAKSKGCVVKSKGASHKQRCIAKSKGYISPQ